MRTFRPVLLFSIVQLIALSMPAQPQLKKVQQPSAAVTIKTASGRLGRKNRASIVKMSFAEVDVSRYEFGDVFVELKVSPGGCDAALVAAAAPTQDNRQMLEFTRAFSGDTSTANALTIVRGHVILLGKKVDKFYVSGMLIPQGIAAWYSKDCNGSYQITVSLRGAKVSSTPPPSPPPHQSAPCGDREIQTDYDKHSPNYHHYGPYETWICPTSFSQCTRRSVFNTMLRQVSFITPTLNAAPVRNCMVADASPVIGEHDEIRVVIDPGNFSVTNYTRPGHIFYPGEVVRTVVEKNGGIYIVTTGEGTGNWKGLNMFVSGPVWHEADRRVQFVIRQQFPTKFRL